MRPRVFPAEDLTSAVGQRYRFHGFNEAAGIPRGRLVLVEKRPGPAHHASMRPRVFPAEDTDKRGNVELVKSGLQ